MSYQFTDNKGTFELKNPSKSSYMYFPLCNDAGVKSSITPELGGDMKLNQNAFVLAPVSSEELHNLRGTRNMWVKVKDESWSLTGNSAKQHSLIGTKDEEETFLKAGFLYHEVTRRSERLKLQSTITSFVPVTDDKAELSRFVLTNTGDETLEVEATSAIPLYGRSADNYRDHRHVTSLLNRISSDENGLSIKPTLSFDERGHLDNHNIYGVSVACENSSNELVDPIGVIPTVEEFIGEGGTLDRPLALLNREETMQPLGTCIDGYEAMAALGFPSVKLEPGQSLTVYIGIYVDEKESADYAGNLKKDYLCKEAFETHLENNKKYWQEKVSVVSLSTGDHNFDSWMKWINLQPILRRIYGCSFLPHHDYGRGGRGWRDLWQDCLALLLMEPKEVRYLLLNNFAGVRIDGTNATIIGSEPGEFVADRNNISRTWMDHGAWPWLTTKEYIHQSGDIDFLFEEQSYFKDALVSRSNDRDTLWNESMGHWQKTEDKSTYKGTLMEHLLVQNLSIFYHVGEHNILQLEGADWNDALDMADERGESVAFTCLYTNNLREMIAMLRDIKKLKGIDEIELAEEMMILLEKVDNQDIQAKHSLLNRYFEAVKHSVTGKKAKLSIDEICNTIEEKIDWMTNHLIEQEFISNEEDFAWFNSYYDNHGKRVEGDFPSGVRMMLTGQVFSLMGNIATDSQAKEIVKTCKHYLQDLSVGGYRLNTNFNEVKKDLGRGFGFAYGHKENGAMFSHMAIMYANALYKRGFSAEGYELIKDMYLHCYDFEKSRIYPSVPEYINERGRGMYTYLTGSASWLLYSVVSEMFGCKGEYGNLVLDPKLMVEQFKSGSAFIEFLYDQEPLSIEYVMDKSDDTENLTRESDYLVSKVTYGDKELKNVSDKGKFAVAKEDIKKIQEEEGSLKVFLV